MVRRAFSFGRNQRSPKTAHESQENREEVHLYLLPRSFRSLPIFRHSSLLSSKELYLRSCLRRGDLRAEPPITHKRGGLARRLVLRCRCQHRTDVGAHPQDVRQRACPLIGTLTEYTGLSEPNVARLPLDRSVAGRLQGGWRSNRPDDVLPIGPSMRRI